MANSQVPSSQQFAVQIPKLVEAGQREFNKETFRSLPPVDAVGTVAAAGSAQSDAGIVPSKPVVSVSASDGTKGVILPRIETGSVIKIYNSVASQNLKVYPHVGGTINGGSANAAITQAGKTFAIFQNLDGTNWAAIYS